MPDLKQLTFWSRQRTRQEAGNNPDLAAMQPTVGDTGADMPVREDLQPEAGAGVMADEPERAAGDHEFSAIAMVTEGVFTMKYEDGEVAYKAGDWCEVPAGTMHTEQTGAEGAKLLFGKK